MNGAQAMLEWLAGSGIRYLFGNPGSSELPLMDALVGEQRLQYVLGLQEIPVMAIADGYAQASGGPAVINLHIACGLGNAMGMLYNSWRSGTPLVVTAGQQDRRLLFEEPVLWGDLVSVARPWTKWAAEVQRVEDLPSALRRAFTMAMTPPRGPVFLSLPVDVQMAAGEMDLTPARLPGERVRPPREAIEEAADCLAGARAPVILAGSRVCEAGAIGELVRVAELLGAPVIHEGTPSHGRCSFPPRHPLAGGLLPMWSPQARERLWSFDVMLAVGVKLLHQYIYHEPSRPIPEHLRIVHLDENPWELGKNYPEAASVLGHPRESLAELAALLGGKMAAPAVAEARARAQRHASKHLEARESLRRQAREEMDLRPMSGLGLMECLAGAIGAATAVVEESPTTSKSYFEVAGVLEDPTAYFGHRGWALGWGLNCAIGVKLAWPSRPVLAIIGDGSALYGIQGLWTAVRYGLPLVAVICNNREYRILKECGDVFRLPQAQAGNYVGQDLSGPDVDFVALAQSFGFPAIRASDPDTVRNAVKQALEDGAPLLVDVPVRGRRAI